ncbi:MAG: hypothetical protein ABI203_07785 [Mucilaginibacter sp.]
MFGARGFKFEDESIIFDIYKFTKETSKKIITITISSTIFESDGKLKFIRKTDWDDNWVTIIEIDIPEDDDLSF